MPTLSPPLIHASSFAGPPLMRTSTAALWAISARIVAQAARFGSAVILARLLVPAEFGIVAMAFAVSGLATVLTDVGLRSAVVQFRTLDKSGLSTAFWMSAGLGALLAGALGGVSGSVAEFSRMPVVGPVLMAMAFGLLLSSIAAVPIGILNIRMEFHNTALVEISSEVVAAGVAIFLAIQGARHWALVGQSLTSAGLTALLSFAVSGWLPGFAFRRDVCSRVARFSGNMMAFNILNYWARNLDTLLIGRAFGGSALGYYNRAYSLMMYPYTMLHGSLSPVLHSALSTMQYQASRMRSSYLRFSKISMMISVPIAVTFGLLAKPLILTVWGPRWLPSVPVFQILCIVTAIQPVFAASGSVYLACGRTDLWLKLGGVYIAMACTGMICGLRWQVQGVAAGYAIANLVTIPPILGFITRKLLGGSGWDLLRQASTPVACSAAAALSVLIWNMAAAPHLPAAVHLLAGVALAGAAVLATACAIDYEFVKDCGRLAPAPMRGIFRHASAD
jgi:PST family polysaccharide transporter